MGNMRLRLVREESSQSLTQPTQAFLNQAVYVGSLDPHNEEMAQTLLAVTPADLSNMLASLGIAADNVQEDNPSSINKLDAKTFSNKLKAFFEHVEIRELKTPEFGWVIPRKIFPDSGLLPVKAVYKGNRLLYVKISSSSNEGKSNEDLLVKEAEIEFIGHQPFLIAEQKREPLPARVSLIVDGIVSFPAQLMQDSLKNAKEVSDLQFNVEYEIFKGLIPYGSLKIAQAVIHGEHSPFWVQRQERILSLPTDAEMGDGVLFPKTFKDAGVLIGDQGYLSYYAPTPTAVQEQRVPIYVAGFYDPGIIPLGGKFLIANQQLTSLIRSAHATEESTVTNGINVRFANIDDADQVKQDLQKMFEQNGIASYWKIETFKEFEFTKDLIQQLSSDKNLFTLIATVIIIVACSNIISMLIILVNDKKLEIGILRSMGASSLSIATIFGICSLMIGAVGSVIGVIAALITLTNLDLLVSLLSRIQGHQAFNPIFYGESLPNEVSFEALAFVVISTTLVSFVAGIIPAIKACLLKPSAILRSE
jgi:lipoprotein-releasing system permease protein